MIEPTKIAFKLENLREYTRYLRSYQKHSLNEIENDYTLRAAIERYFQLSIECVIDICQIIISGLKLKRPVSYRESIDILGSEKIIPDDFAYYFAPITGFRNVLVHEYTEIDLAEVYRHLQKDLDDFDKFSKYISEYLLTQSSF